VGVKKTKTKMKLIYTCLFLNPDYIKLLELLVYSLYSFGNMEDTKFLIYTSDTLAEEVKKSKFYKEDFLFEINNDYCTPQQACKARLDVFSFSCIKNYSHILYLDTDILVVRDFSNAFSLLKEEKIYAWREGNLDWNPYPDYWGKRLFTQEELDRIEERTCFCAGIMFFLNCETIQNLFETIKNHMNERPEYALLADQEFLNYHCKTKDLVDTITVCPFIINMPCVDPNVNYLNDNNHNQVGLFHFCGSYGGELWSCNNKYTRMKDFLIYHGIEYKN